MLCGAMYLPEMINVSSTLAQAIADGTAAEGDGWEAPEWERFLGGGKKDKKDGRQSPQSPQSPSA